MGVRASYQVKPKQTGMFVFRIESHLSQWERVKARERESALFAQNLLPLSSTHPYQWEGEGTDKESARERGAKKRAKNLLPQTAKWQLSQKQKKKLNPKKLKKGIRRSCV